MAGLSYSWEAITEKLPEMVTYAIYKQYGIVVREQVYYVRFTISGVGTYEIADIGVLCYSEDHIAMMREVMTKHRAMATVIAENIVRLENADQVLQESWSVNATDAVHLQLIQLITTLKQQAQDLDKTADCTECYLKMCGEFKTKYKWDRRTNYTYA